MARTISCKIYLLVANQSCNAVQCSAHHDVNSSVRLINCCFESVSFLHGMKMISVLCKSCQCITDFNPVSKRCIYKNAFVHAILFRAQQRTWRIIYAIIQWAIHQPQVLAKLGFIKPTVAHIRQRCRKCTRWRDMSQ